jgi:hypothetical protein
MNTSDRFFDLMNGLKRLMGRPVQMQKQTLTRYQAALEKFRDEAKSPYKALLVRAVNEVRSLKDGLESGDADQKDLEALVLTVNGLWTNCKKAEYIDKTQGPKTTDEPLSDKDSALHDKTTQSIQKYDKFKALLPQSVGAKSFKAIKMPVGVVTKNMLLQAKLEKMHLSTGSIEGYPILDNQVVVGLSDWFLAKHKHDLSDAVEEVLESIEDKTGQRYNHMGSGRLHGNVLWVWLANDRTVRLLTQASVGGSFIVKGWDFPFTLTKLRAL